MFFLSSIQRSLFNRFSSLLCWRHVVSFLFMCTICRASLSPSALTFRNDFYTSNLRLINFHLCLLWPSVGGRWQLPRRMKSHRGMKNSDTQGAWAKLPSSLDCSRWNPLTAFFPLSAMSHCGGRWNLSTEQMESCATTFSTIFNCAMKNKRDEGGRWGGQSGST